jgi:hypothetical protein
VCTRTAGTGKRVISRAEPVPVPAATHTRDPRGSQDPLRALSTVYNFLQVGDYVPKAQWSRVSLLEDGDVNVLLIQ